MEIPAPCVRDWFWRPFMRHGRAVEEIGLAPDHERLDGVTGLPDAIPGHQAATVSG